MEIVGEEERKAKEEQENEGWGWRKFMEDRTMEIMWHGDGDSEMEWERKREMLFQDHIYW